MWGFTLPSLSPLSSFVSPAKAKGQPAKVNINAALVEDIISLDEVEEDMTAVLNALKDDFTRSLSIRTSPGTDLISASLVSTKMILSIRLYSLEYKTQVLPVKHEEKSWTLTLLEP